MKARQENKISMYYVVRDVCEKYKPVWTKNSVFSSTYDLWVSKIPLIEENRDIQILETTGITTNKIGKRAVMIDKALFVMNRLQSYANVVNDSELLESVSYTVSVLKKSRDTDVIGMCNVILSKANAFATVIVDYGVSAAMITELELSIAAYYATLPKPKAAISKSKTATENLERLFKESDELLIKRLDLDIELFRIPNPDFYSQYKSARIIISTGGSVVSVLGSVNNAQSGEPLRGVKFSFVVDEKLGVMKTGTEVGKPIVKKSADKGRFRVPLPENMYRVRVEKIGYKPQEIVITVSNGESTVLNVELEKVVGG